MADEGSSSTVEVECGSGNEYDGRLGLRVSSIFVILVGSLIGSLGPIVLSKTSRVATPRAAFFIAKYFGSGVIIATAFIHLLAPAVEALSSPCIDEDNPITQYSWPEGIALMTVFSMFFVELLASRFGIPGFAAKEPVSGKSSDPELKFENGSGEPGNGDATMFNDARGVALDQDAGDYLASQLTAIFILEFGVLFHSIFIGLTLAVSGDEFKTLYIVLVFHQTFEGLGLGSRLAATEWPSGKGWLAYLLAILYSLSTPIAIAAGLGIRETLKPESQSTLIINGIFDSISAGILLYTGLVELMAHEFLFSAEMQRRSLNMTLAAFACMCVGAGLMALLGKWA